MCLPLFPSLPTSLSLFRKLHPNIKSIDGSTSIIKHLVHVHDDSNRLYVRPVPSKNYWCL